MHLLPHMIHTSLRVIVSLLCAASITHAQTHRVFINHNGTEPGTAGTFMATVTDGKITGLSPLPSVEAHESTFKLAITDSGKTVAIASFVAGDPTLVLHSTDGTGEPRIVALEREVEELRAFGENIFINGDSGRFFIVDTESASITHTWNARQGLQPPGHKGEDVRLLPDENLAFVSFQKDHQEGERRGSRLVILDLEKLEALHDLQLPRDRPDLHIDGNNREQGPNPELIFLSPQTNTIALSLDLYGAVAFADYDAALRGQWTNLEYKSTSHNGEWGVAFPDRGVQFVVGDQSLLLISNASEDGGMILFDMATREILKKFEVPAGTDHPAFLKPNRVAATVLSGKAKAREDSGLSNVVTPGSAIYLFSMEPEPTLETIPTEENTIRFTALNPESSSEIAVVLQKDDTFELAIFNTQTRTFTDRKPLPSGEITRMVSRTAP